MTYLLYTDRLYLRPCQLEELKALYELWSNREIRRFLFDDRKITLEEAQAFISRSVESFQNYGYGIWLFFEYQQNAIAGFTGLLDYTQEAPSLIFGTSTQLWGNSIARSQMLMNPIKAQFAS
jgi:[ribosomal protein S5]-alanine N-acetyltransferase